MGAAHNPINRRALLRGTIIVAGSAVVLPGLATLGGCSATPPALTERMGLIGAVADRIIPATETGGALAAQVPAYIAAVYDQHFTAEQQLAFAQGLGALDAVAASHGAASFEGATTAQQDAALTDLSTGSDREGKAIFQQLRDLTVFGYYTSEVASEELAYEEIPGRYDGCVPLAEIGSAWLERGV